VVCHSARNRVPIFDSVQAVHVVGRTMCPAAPTEIVHALERLLNSEKITVQRYDHICRLERRLENDAASKS
jgi:hypothetical protein